MLISGTPGTTADWLRAGNALSLANGWAAAHRGYAPIMVMPDANGTMRGDTECVDGPRGNAETYLTVDVPDYLYRRFGVSRDPRHWAIAGLSEGGTCALTLAARHPNLFATLGDFWGDPAPTLGSARATQSALYGNAPGAMYAHNPAVWFRRDAATGLAGFFAVGNADGGHLRSDVRTERIAAARGIEARLDVIAGGGHNFFTWSRALRDAFPWIAGRLGLRVPPSAVSFAQPGRPPKRLHQT
jgi:S-formylglutathione hydrolase FrmB